MEERFKVIEGGITDVEPEPFYENNLLAVYWDDEESRYVIYVRLLFDPTYLNDVDVEYVRTQAQEEFDGITVDTQDLSECDQEYIREHSLDSFWIEPSPDDITPIAAIHAHTTVKNGIPSDTSKLIDKLFDSIDYHLTDDVDNLEMVDKIFEVTVFDENDRKMKVKRKRFDIPLNICGAHETRYPHSTEIIEVVLDEIRVMLEDILPDKGAAATSVQLNISGYYTQDIWKPVPVEEEQK